MVAKLLTFWILLTLAIAHKWPLLHFDISNAFLHGMLYDTIYMKQPLGFQNETHPDYVCFLKMSLYGLK